MYNHSNEPIETQKKLFEAIVSKKKAEYKEWLVDQREDKMKKHKELLSQVGHKRKDDSGKIPRRRNLQEKLTIHIVPHTHNDVGWLETPDEYFAGGNRRTKAFVNMIISTAVRELLRDEKRRFTYTEMKYFSMWYRNQKDELKAKVK